MHRESDNARDTAKENPVGQDSAKNEYGEIGAEVDQPGSYPGARQTEIEGEGFILQQPGEAASAKATEGTDFAAQGRGAIESEDEASSEGGVG